MSGTGRAHRRPSGTSGPAGAPAGQSARRSAPGPDPTHRRCHPVGPGTSTAGQPFGPQRQFLEVVERLEPRQSRPVRRPVPAPNRGAGRPAPCCGPAPDRAGRCPSTRPAQAPSVPSPAAVAHARAPPTPVDGRHRPTTDTPAVVLETGEPGQRVPPRGRGTSGAGIGDQLSHRPRPGPPRGVVTSRRPTPLPGGGPRHPGTTGRSAGTRRRPRAPQRPPSTRRRGALLGQGSWPPRPGGRPRPRRSCTGPHRAAAGPDGAWTSSTSMPRHCALRARISPFPPSP